MANWQDRKDKQDGASTLVAVVIFGTLFMLLTCPVALWLFSNPNAPLREQLGLVFLWALVVLLLMYLSAKDEG